MTSQQAGESDDVHGPIDGAFFEQAQWLLTQQQRRSDSFRQIAVAILGIDGGLLALLAGGWSSGTATWAPGAPMIACLVFVASSALLASGAIVPRRSASVPIAEVKVRWEQYRRGELNFSVVHDFANMLLADGTADKAAVNSGSGSSTADRSPNRLWRRVRRAAPPNVLASAKWDADRRSSWASASSFCLALAISALAASLLWGVQH